MGKPAWGNAHEPRERGEPGELKHLSTLRKREHSASSGERKRSSLNRRKTGLKDTGKGGKRKWKGVGKPTKEGESPVDASNPLAVYPE